MGSEQTSADIRSAASIYREMRTEALCVPWREIVGAGESILQYESLALWTRAIAKCEGMLPEWVCVSVESRCPKLRLDRHRTNADNMYDRIRSWTVEKRLRAARDAGWLQAAHYYAGRTPRSERIWQHFDGTVAEWSEEKPDRYPDFDEWIEASDRRIPASLPVGTSVSPGLLDAWINDYIESEALAYWARLHIERSGNLATSAVRELQERCPEFIESFRTQETANPARFVSTLMDWIELNRLAQAGEAQCLDTVRQFARQHPRADRVLEYWAICSSEGAKCLDGFERWLCDMDAYVVR